MYALLSITSVLRFILSDAHFFLFYEKIITKQYYKTAILSENCLVCIYVSKVLFLVFI